MSEIRDIIEFAESKGMDTLDTAISYGDCHERLGLLDLSDWKVITKLPKIDEKTIDIIKWIRDHIDQSLRDLNLSSIDAVLLHNPDDLLGPDGNRVWFELDELKRKGKIKKIGFSIYEVSELEELLLNFDPDIVQAPYNILDQSLVTSGWLEKMKQLGIQVHVRSIFLQGLLLMSKSDRPEKFNKWSQLWGRWDNWLEENKVEPLHACLAFANAETQIDRIIIGVNSLNHLKEIAYLENSNLRNFPENIESNDSNLINPSRW